MTKSEMSIIEKVKDCNERGYLCGLSTSPDDKSYNEKPFRFVKRLHLAGKIVWMKWNFQHGAGWCLPETTTLFS